MKYVCKFFKYHCSAFVTLVIVLAYGAEMFGQNANNLVNTSLLKSGKTDSAWQITSEHISSTSGMKHIYFRQTVGQIPIEGTESSLHFTSNGTLVFENLQFIPLDEIKKKSPLRAVMPPIRTIETIANAMGYQRTAPTEYKQNKQSHFNEIWLHNSGISQRDIRAQLLYISTDSDSNELVWRIDILELENQHWWEFYVDACTGRLIRKEDKMLTCYTDELENRDRRILPNPNLIDPSCRPFPDAISTCSDCYEVFAYPLESPYFGGRSIEENPAHPVASPFGWHDVNGLVGPEFTTTRGNNVDAYEANDNFGYHPDGGLGLDFTGFEFDQVFSYETQYEEASITNLFYWCNIIHDITYQYGFTENAGNFQVNNYDRGGIEGDDVIAFGQSMDRRCNASFSTPEDGERPQMIINLCGDKDGDFDATVIAHEWGHGLSNRLTGGGVFNNCLRNKENPSEGWSDWLATVLTIRPEDTGSTPRYIASYLKGDEMDGPGVRFYPYSTNMDDNPLTYDDLPHRAGVHRIGAIWGQMIWEVTWALIDEYGYNQDVYNFTGDVNIDAGNVMALAIIIEGLKLTPCRPGFVDARDGIVTAARQLYGREVLCAIWEAFAKRGLGIFAEQGDSDNQFDGASSYATPFEKPNMELDADVFCFEYGTYDNLNGGRPIGGYYEGPGVMDNGDGETFNFDPFIAGVGTHTITYILSKTECSDSESISKEVRVERDIEAPEIVCVRDVAFSVPSGQAYELFDFRNSVTVTDNCPGELVFTQIPEPGSLITTSENEIEIMVRDGVGNEVSCSFILTLVFTTIEEIEDGALSVLPIPAKDHVVVFNPKERKIFAIEIWNIMGQRVLINKFNNSEIENQLSVEELSSGTYFMTINLSDRTQVLRLIKQ